MSSTPQEVFAHHAEVLIGGDLEGIVSDYADDARLHHARRRAAWQGRGARGLHEAARPTSRTPSGRFRPQIFEGDVLFIEWSAKAARLARRGRDRHVRFRDGEITVQTDRYTLIT